jgi:hypothetical protein
MATRLSFISNFVCTFNKLSHKSIIFPSVKLIFNFYPTKTSQTGQIKECTRTYNDDHKLHKWYNNTANGKKSENFRQIYPNKRNNNETWQTVQENNNVCNKKIATNLQKIKQHKMKQY